MINSSRLAPELVRIGQRGTDSYHSRNDTFCLSRNGLHGRIDHQTSRRVNVCLQSRHPLQHCSRRIIHTLSTAIQKTNSPIIGLPARIALFVVVAVPLLRVCFSVEMEDLVNTRSSIFSSDPSPVDTTEVLIYIDQTLHLVMGVSSVYLCQFVANVAFRRCSTRSWTVLESRCSLTSNLVRRSEGRQARIYGHSSST